MDKKNFPNSQNELLAPNGKPSSLSPELYAYVRTPEFKEWFGDWEREPLKASRVLDENGEPLVLYRGQMSHDNVPFVNHGDGIYFTPDREAAIGYGADGNPIPAFLNARKPYEVNFEGDADTEDNEYHADVRGEYHYAVREGFDILIAKNTFDGENDLDQFVVMKDEQIRRIDILNLQAIDINQAENKNSSINMAELNQISPGKNVSDNEFVLNAENELKRIMNNSGIDFIQRNGAPLRIVNDDFGSDPKYMQGEIAYIKDVHVRNDKLYIDGNIDQDGTPLHVSNLSELGKQGIENLVNNVKEVFESLRLADSLKELQKGCEFAELVDTPIQLHQAVDLSYTDVLGNLVDEKYSVAVVNEADTIVLYINKEDALKNFNPYFLEDLDQSKQKSVINDLSDIVANANLKNLQETQPSLITELGKGFMSQAAADLSTGNHLIFPREDAYTYFMNSLQSTIERVKENNVTAEDRSLIVKLSQQFHGGMNELADVIGVDKNKLINNLLAAENMPDKKEMVHFLSEQLGENKGIGFAAMDNIYLLSKKSNTPFEVNLIERNKKGDILLSGMDKNDKWHSVKAESIPSNDLKAIYDYLKNNPVSLEENKDIINKTINHSSIMNPDLENKQSVEHQNAVPSMDNSMTEKKGAKNDLGKETKELLTLNAISEKARKNLDLPFPGESVVIVRSIEQGSRNNVYRAFGEDADRLYNASKTLYLSTPEIKGQQYHIVEFNAKEAKDIAKDLADANISIALVNKNGVAIKNDNAFKLDSPQKSEDLKAANDVKNVSADAKKEEEFQNRFRVYNENHKTDAMVVMNMKNSNGSFYQSFGQDAETAAAIIGKSVKTNSLNVSYISFKEDDFNKIKDYMKEAGKQQPLVIDYTVPNRDKAKDVSVEIKPESKVEFDIAKNQHAKGVYDIQLLVDGKKLAAHHLSKDDRDAFFKKEIPGNDLVQKYFTKELNGATPDVSRVQKENNQHSLMETVNGQKVTDARTFTSEKGTNYFVASLDGKQLRPQFIDAETKQKFDNKEITVKDMMQIAYPTKLMQKLEDSAFDNKKLSDGREVSFFRIDKEAREDRKDFGKYKLEAIVDGQRLRSDPLSVRNLNEYFDKVTSKSALVERVFGEQLNMKSAYEKYKLPEGAVMGENATFRIEKDNAQRRYFISGEVNGTTLDRKQLSYSDASSHWKKAATEEQLGAKYFKKEITSALKTGENMSLNLNKSHSHSM